MIIMEIFCPVGGVIEHYGKQIKAVEVAATGETPDTERCQGCIYNKSYMLAQCTEMQCNAEDRDDDKYVIFQEVK